MLRLNFTGWFFAALLATLMMSEAPPVPWRWCLLLI
jgi:hypothetical protein